MEIDKSTFNSLKMKVILWNLFFGEGDVGILWMWILIYRKFVSYLGPQNVHQHFRFAKTYLIYSKVAENFSPADFASEKMDGLMENNDLLKAFLFWEGPPGKLFRRKKTLTSRIPFFRCEISGGEDGTFCFF